MTSIKDIKWYKQYYTNNPDELMKGDEVIHKIIKILLNDDFKKEFNSTNFSDNDIAAYLQLVQKICDNKIASASAYKDGDDITSKMSEVANYHVKSLIKNRATYLMIYLQFRDHNSKLRKAVNDLKVTTVNVKGSILEAFPAGKEREIMEKMLGDTPLKNMIAHVKELQNLNDAYDKLVNKTIPEVAGWLSVVEPK